MKAYYNEENEPQNPQPNPASIDKQCQEIAISQLIELIKQSKDPNLQLELTKEIIKITHPKARETVQIPPAAQVAPAEQNIPVIVEPSITRRFHFPSLKNIKLPALSMDAKIIAAGTIPIVFMTGLYFLGIKDINKDKTLNVIRNSEWEMLKTDIKRELITSTIESYGARVIERRRSLQDSMDYIDKGDMSNARLELAAALAIKARNSDPSKQAAPIINLTTAREVPAQTQERIVVIPQTQTSAPSYTPQTRTIYQTDNRNMDEYRKTIRDNYFEIITAELSYTTTEMFGEHSQRRVILLEDAKKAAMADDLQTAYIKIKEAQSIKPQ
ncbi:hypothetical protein ACFL6Y_01445 [Elusimicrobiota bacterium]